MRRRRFSGALQLTRIPTARVLWVLAWGSGSLAVTAGACKSITPPPGADGSGGAKGSGGSQGGGNDGGPDVAALDMSTEKFSAGDMINNDGACSAVRSGARLVPLDLYVMMDSSKSMNDPDAMGMPKWNGLKTAMSGFFSDMNSSDFSVALAYFPAEASGVPDTCSSDGDCKNGSGPCDERRACVFKGRVSMAPSTVCFTNADCTGDATDGDTCVPVQHCTMGEGCMARNCVADPSGTMACPSDCMAFTRYCRGRDICDGNQYATPTVPFGALSDPAVVKALNDSLGGHSPDGFTPTGPALTGALKAARQRALDQPDHQVAVVLVTDGLPGAFIPGSKGTPAACTPPDVPGVASLLSGPMGLGGTPPIPTFVIGIFGMCDLQQGNTQMPKEKLNTWAVAGGTKEAVIVDTTMNVTTQIQDAFKQVQSKVVTCQYAIPKNVVGGIDYMKVNVDFSSTAMMTPTSIHYVGTKDKCDSNTGGWYYDVPDPTKATPTQIIACDKSCADFKAAPGAQVDVALGCATVL